VIITDRFVFLHLHKSGGSFVNEFLLRFVPRARSVGYHLPRLLTPSDSVHLPVLGFVRNPWSYYVSWYNFQAQRPAPNSLFRILSQNGKLEFGGTVRNILQLGSGGSHLDAVIASLPPSYGTSGLNLPKFALAGIRNSGLGFYSFLYTYMYGELDGKLTVQRAENLRHALLEYLDSVGQRVTNAANDFVMDAKERNTSEHRPYVDYYDDELRDLVADKDKLLISRHGYRFGD
jgi:hypothetical protein